MDQEDLHHDKRPKQNSFVLAAFFGLVSHIVLSLIIINTSLQYYDKDIQGWSIAIISISIVFVILSLGGVSGLVSKALKYILLIAISGMIYGGIWLFIQIAGIIIALILAKGSQHYP